MIEMKKMMAPNIWTIRGGRWYIFDRDDRIDEVMDNDYDYDGEENVDLEITETGEVYLYNQASGDHHVF